MLSFTSIVTVILFLSYASVNGGPTSNDPLFWSALITPQFDNNGQWNCSGAYIGKKHVITSGVCVQGYTSFRIQLGAYKVHYQHHNPDYNVTKLDFIYDKTINTNIGSKHDSADKKLTIIRLDEDPAITWSAYIKPIALPPEPTLVQLNDALDGNTSMLVWGRNRGYLSQQSLNMNVLLFLDCLTVRPEVNIHTELCATGDKFDGKYLYLCPNFGFGPLLVYGLNTVTLIGIGIDNCVDDKPQTFLRINGYWKWIMEVQSYVE